jgi:hypothetical protein
MKPFARMSDAYDDHRAVAAKAAPAQLQRRWIKTDGRLECRYVMVRAD